ncbi:hypothetical protein [Paraglaciecola sp.]|uniref:hypothetical protein n=1 Tax=Paraglaciecola sp. TaxID=1920173 RepID=UPI003EF1E9F2
MRKSIVIIFISLVPFLSFGGGSHFPVEITDFKQSQESFNLIAKVHVVFNYDSSNCSVIELTGEYDKQRWKNHTKLINKSIHLKSLELLQKAYTDKAVINLGFLGGGFFKTGHCSYNSKGLFHYENGVYSIYGSI